MKYRTLGSTGLRVSVIGVGTWQLGGEWGKDFTQEEVDPMFKRAHELGINLIDTAECYGDHASERLIGGAIEKTRKDWILATKFGHKFTGHMQRDEPRSPKDVIVQLEDSLKALRTDYVDLNQYHSWSDDQFFDDDVLAAMNKAKDQGKVLHIGNSIAGNQGDVLTQVDPLRKRGIEVLQVVYNRLDRRPEAGVFASCMRQNVGVLARVPMASGFLSGKYKPGTRFGKDDVRASRDEADTDAKLIEVEKIAREELPANVPMAHWALAWCLQHPAVTSVIPGCKDVKQVESNAAAADLDLVKTDHPQAAKSLENDK